MHFDRRRIAFFGASLTPSEAPFRTGTGGSPMARPRAPGIPEGRRSVGRAFSRVVGYHRARWWLGTILPLALVRGLTPLVRRPALHSGGSLEHSFRPDSGEMRSVGDVCADVMADAAEGFAHLVKVFAESRLLRFFGHRINEDSVVPLV